LLYIAASVEQYCDITQVNALPENEGILEVSKAHIRGDMTTIAAAYCVEIDYREAGSGQI